jgi:hypothetical protein
MSAICLPMSGRLAAYLVVVADDLTLGLIQLDVSAQQWIATTVGSENSVAVLRRFLEKDDAVRWLQEHGPAPRGSAETTVRRTTPVKRRRYSSSDQSAETAVWYE